MYSSDVHLEDWKHPWKHFWKAWKHNSLINSFGLEASNQILYHWKHKMHITGLQLRLSDFGVLFLEVVLLSMLLLVGITLLSTLRRLSRIRNKTSLLVLTLTNSFYGSLRTLLMTNLLMIFKTLHFKIT